MDQLPGITLSSSVNKLIINLPDIGAQPTGGHPYSTNWFIYHYQTLNAYIPGSGTTYSATVWFHPLNIYPTVNGGATYTANVGVGGYTFSFLNSRSSDPLNDSTEVNIEITGFPYTNKEFFISGEIYGEQF